ncbi:putative ribose-phosphate pyrophosphokinase [Histomonas meleagridis]|uniref:putative ribose-phosphate pyrophosphokinase n=1 Tax=Histomonas meleagridis TaxID=135588 RepID=UPI003559DFB7|nr:putative ribose-phosphate pyrophosphokinase [Histomonas meleagridis]KAH0796213.1 putative ribose-phosphate pyrophosphokinase [Histomonas meleagridis]
MQEAKEEQQNSSELNLITNSVEPDRNTDNSGRFLSLKVSLLLAYLVPILFDFYPSIKVFLTLLFSTIEIWFCKNVDGLNLVGMRWYHDTSSGEPKWIFYSRPDPYVPEAYKSNIFWGGLFGIIVVWFIIFIWSIFSFSWFDTFICACIIGVESLNLICFLKCRSESSRQADEVVRSVLLGEMFDSDDLSDHDENQKKQDEPNVGTEETQNNTETTQT